MTVDDFVSNKSGNRPFEDVLRARVSRRGVMAGGLAAAATTFFAPGLAAAQAGGNGGTPGSARGIAASGRELIGFDPVAVADGGGPLPAISSDYQYQVLIPWGEPIVAPYPEHVNGSKSAADQEKQIGIGHDGMWLFPTSRKGDRGILCLNHEFGTNPHVFGKDTPESLEEVRLSQAAHGISVVEIANISGTWQVVRGDYNRRITVNTPVEFSGPVAGHSILGDPSRPSFGTLNNCSSGYTPWGTYVTCEENFNGYFGATGAWTPTEAQDRYGFSTVGFEYGWELFDPRFDLLSQDYAGEDNRFGWCVEIDPMNPNATPVKRTAMGRCKHEGAAFTTGRGGRIVAYMGDDQRFDYIYKFVSDGNWKSMRARGMSPLDHGTLYVARFDDDGTGEWLALTIDNPTLAAQFEDQAEVLTYARLAADALGATPMDRPEWTTVAPDGRIYCSLTNNSQRTEADAANPLAPNPDGHIIRWTDADQHVGTSFEWDIFIIAQDTHGTEDTFSDPDGLWADPDGRIFIETDGGQKDGLNNQLLVADSELGELRRLLTGVAGDEITGLTVTPDRRTLFCNTQHPGEGDPTLTNFPVMNAVPDGVTVPRDCTFVITRKDGGVVGS
jgi:secreted PhoX family phosphatase